MPYVLSGLIKTARVTPQVTDFPSRPCYALWIIDFYEAYILESISDLSIDQPALEEAERCK
jgi:hypothetical protein